MHWFKKGILKKYPSTLYISLNRGTYSEVDVVCENNRQELIQTKSCSSLNDINSDSICSSLETYQV